MAKVLEKRSLIPIQVKWEEVGASVEGTLLSKEETMYRDNTRGRYLISTVDGLRVVLGTFQIDQALKLVCEGEDIGIVYIGEEGTNSGNRFKTFEIWVVGETGAESAPPEAKKPEPEPVKKLPV